MLGALAYHCYEPTPRGPVRATSGIQTGHPAAGTTALGSKKSGHESSALSSCEQQYAVHLRRFLSDMLTLLACP